MQVTKRDTRLPLGDSRFGRAIAVTIGFVCSVVNDLQSREQAHVRIYGLVTARGCISLNDFANFRELLVMGSVFLVLRLLEWNTECLCHYSNTGRNAAKGNLVERRDCQALAKSAWER